MIDILSDRTPGAVWSGTNGDDHYSAGVTRMANTDENGKREWRITLGWPENGVARTWFSRRGEGIFVPAHKTDAREVLATLASFVGAWDEAQRYEGSDNADMFPSECEPFLTVAEDFANDTYREI